MMMDLTRKSCPNCKLALDDCYLCTPAQVALAVSEAAKRQAERERKSPVDQLMEERDRLKSMLVELCHEHMPNIGTKSQFLSFGGASWPNRTMENENWARWERARLMAGIGPDEFLEPDNRQAKEAT